MTTQTLRHSVVAGYRIIRQLATGGSSRVFEALKIGPGGFRKAVALKRLQPSRALTAGALQRFLQEARVTALLDHPNIVRVHDLVMEDDEYVLVMELLRGSDVQALIDRMPTGRLPPSIALSIADQALAGLEHAHAQGLVHRDLTCRNLFVTDDGTVKILDFGIAKLVDSVATTQVGEIRGTIEFLSPEHARGERVDARSDLYQLGAVLYYMLSGGLPFGAGNAPEILSRIREGTPPPIEALDDVRPDLAALVVKALARDPEQRFPDALKMREAVRSVLAEWPDSGKQALADWSRAPITQGTCDVPPVDDVPDVSWLPSRFEVQRIIGRGGMGLVLEAKDQTLGRTVALKLIPRDTDETARQRFLQEARSAATLGHPGIITVFDVDPDGRYIVMERVNGESLAERLQRITRLPAVEVRRVGVALLAALEAAHQASLIHRDVKPSNILFDDNGSIKLGDFGVATFIHSEVTNAGTPAYMAPEQLRGDTVDVRADIYSAGATLYEAATGERLHGDTERTSSVLEAVAEATADRSLAAAVDRAVSEQMSARFGTAAAFADALRVRPRRRTRWLVAALTAGVVIAAVAWPRTQPAEPTSSAPLVAPAVAVLPFEIRSQRAESELSASALTAAISDELRHVPHFQVIGFNALRDLVDVKAPRGQWFDAARALGATLVIECAVDDTATGVRVTFTVSKPSGEPITRFTRDGGVTAITWLVRVAAGDIAEAAAEPSFDADRQLRSGIAALEDHDLPTAGKHLRAAQVAAPERPEVYYYLALQGWWASLPNDETLGSIERAKHLGVSDERAGFLDGLRLILSGDPIAAIDHFDAVTRRYPRNRDALYGLAEAQFHGGQPAAAMRSFRRVYDLAPAFGLGLLHPFTYYTAHADEEGMSWALQRLERLKKDSSNQHWIWRVQIARRQSDEALRSIERITADSGPNKTSPSAIAHELAQIHLVNGRMEMASTLLTPPRNDNTQLPYAIALWSIAEAEEDRAGSTKWRDLHVSYSRASGERRAGLEWITDAALLDLAAGRADEMRVDLAGLEGAAMPAQTRGIPFQVARALLSGRLADRSRLAEGLRSRFPEVVAVSEALHAEADRKWSDAANAWRRAIAASNDGRFHIIEWFSLARVERRLDNHDGVLRACDEVIWPRHFHWEWGAAVGPCSSWASEAAQTLQRGTEAKRLRDHLSAIQARARRSGGTR